MAGHMTSIVKQQKRIMTHAAAWPSIQSRVLGREWHHPLWTGLWTSISRIRIIPQRPISQVSLDSVKLSTLTITQPFLVDFFPRCQDALCKKKGLSRSLYIQRLFLRGNQNGVISSFGHG